MGVRGEAAQVVAEAGFASIEILPKKCFSNLVRRGDCSDLWAVREDVRPAR